MNRYTVPKRSAVITYVLLLVVAILISFLVVGIVIGGGQSFNGPIWLVLTIVLFGIFAGLNSWLGAKNEYADFGVDEVSIRFWHCSHDIRYEEIDDILVIDRGPKLALGRNPIAVAMNPGIRLFSLASMRIVLRDGKKIKIPARMDFPNTFMDSFLPFTLEHLQAYQEEGCTPCLLDLGDASYTWMRDRKIYSMRKAARKAKA